MSYKIISLFTFFTCIANHAPAAENTEQNLEEILVTASRTPVPVNQIGSSFTLINADQLRNRQTASLSEILRNVPGFAVSRSGVMGSTTQIRVRGAEANQVLVFIDGIEANDPAQGSEFNFAHLLTSEVDRVEVIRGPQSALWGSDALAGVINITTKRGSGPAKFTAFLEGGSFDTVQGGGNVSGSGKRYNYNLGAAVIDSGGTNISRRGNENDGYANSTINFSGNYQATGNLDLSIAGRYTNATNDYDDIDFINTGLPVDADNHTDTEQFYGRAQAKLSLLDKHWEHIAGAAITSTDNKNYTAGSWSDGTAGKKYRVNYQTSYYLDTPDMLDASHTFTLAVDYEREEYTQRGTATFFGDPNQDLATDATSIVGEYRVNLLEDLSLSGSVRHDYNSDFRDSTTFRVTAAYQLPQTSTLLHANYGTGVKNPSFTERFGFYATSATPFAGNANLRPEQSRGWEIGFTQPLLDGRADIGAAYFNERLQDEINGFVFDPSVGAFGGFTAKNVNGTSYRDGVEVNASIEITKGLSLQGAYTYTDATQPDAANNQQQEVRRPRHIASLNLDYAFLNNRAGVNLNINYTGKQLDDYFPPYPQPARRVTLSSFTLVNLTGRYKLNEHYNFYGRVENLLDEDYEEVYGFHTPGIAVYGGVRIAFQP